MTIELAKPVPDAGDLQRYPTTREIVDAALAQGATLSSEPTGACPNYALPCEDLDSTPHQLVVGRTGRASRPRRTRWHDRGAARARRGNNRRLAP